MSVGLRAGSATDVGLVRSNNQDQLLVADPLFAVADGMGGAAAGEVASAVAIEALNNGFARSGPATAETLVEAAHAANRAVWDEALANPGMRGMGTTLVALALVEEGRLAIVNVGDSRLYGLHSGQLRQITSDHNLVAEMVAEGRISREEAEVHPRRNIMTRALGVEPEVPVDLFVEDATPGDRYLLCSDGLPRELSDELIASLLNRLADPEDAARELVDEAKRRGGNDNITVVVVDVVDPDAPRSEVAAEDGTTVLPPAEEVAGRTGRRFPRRIRRTGTASPVTLRVIAFIVVLLLVLGLGAVGVVWYARSGYFVGLRGSRIVIFQGRPGGVLWLKPTVAKVTRYTTDDILSVSVVPLEGGYEEGSLSDAQAYVTRLVEQKQAAVAAGGAPSMTLPTTVGPTATGPPTT